MDSWILGQVSFWYTVNKVKPAIVVDKIIEVVLDLIVPGRGNGESTWWMKGLRNLEQSSERVQREIDIRTDLRRWDQDFPEIHHELIVRWFSGLIVSMGCTALYNALLKPPKSPPRRGNYR